jgi:ADP-heptose:LPS heptosyltransferase
MALPALRRMRAAHAGAHVCIMWIDGSLEPATVEFDEIRAEARSHPFQTLFRALQGWDIAYANVQGIFSVFTELCIALSRAPVTRGPVAAKDGANRTLYNHPYPLDPRMHNTIVNFLGSGETWMGGPIPYPLSLRITLLPRDPKKKVIAIHVGSGRGYEFKRWPSQRFRELIELLAKEPSFEIVLLCQFCDEREMLQLAANLPVRLLSSSTIPQLLRQTISCDCLVANDSGPAHAAAALDIPVVVLFGPTDPAKVAPVFRRGEIIRGDCQCEPCFDDYPDCAHQQCLWSISAEQVLASILRLVR